MQQTELRPQLAVCTGDFDGASPREFAAAERLIGRFPLVPRPGGIYRVTRLWHEDGAAAPYAALAEEPSGLGYRSDWFRFVLDRADLEMAKFRAIAQQPGRRGAAAAGRGADGGLADELPARDAGGLRLGRGHGRGGDCCASPGNTARRCRPAGRRRRGRSIRSSA